MLVLTKAMEVALNFRSLAYQLMKNTNSLSKPQSDRWS